MSAGLPAGTTIVIVLLANGTGVVASTAAAVSFSTSATADDANVPAAVPSMICWASSSDIPNVNLRNGISVL